MFWTWGPNRAFDYEDKEATESTGVVVPDHRARWSYFVRRCYGEGVSKVAVARHVGSSAGLASERHYLSRTIPTGIARYLGRGKVAPVAAIVVGCTATALGFASGIISTRFLRRAA